MNKREIAQVLEEIAFFLLLKGENPYKARAYRNAATALLTCQEDTFVLVETGMLRDVPGIGPATASVITELVTTGASGLHHDVQGEYPSTLTELEHVPGLSMKQIKRLYERAGITSLGALQQACMEHRLLDVPGFGPKAQEKLQRALGQYHRGQGYHLYANVVAEADVLATALGTIQGVRAVSVAGAMRRKVEVINELAFVLAVDRRLSLAQLARRVEQIPNMTEVSSHRETVTARSPLGLPVLITTATPRHYGSALLRATGSVQHLDELRQRFAERGLADWNAVRDAFAGESIGEEEIYRGAGLPFILPELREGHGEIQWANADALPSPLEAAHIQGFLHAHTVYTDGTGTVEEMVVAAQEQGYRYIGISDHSESAFYVNGLKEDRIRMQWAEIDAVQKTYPDIRILKGIEADILPDGTMDYADGLLAQFDFVIASVHSRFNLPEEQQTNRICRALANPYVTMLGHPTGRLLLSRAGVSRRSLASHQDRRDPS